MATNVAISREVRRYIESEGLTLSEAARQLGYSRSTLNDRLRGRTRWSLDDVDQLRDAGVPLELSTYDVMGVAR